MLLYFIVSFRKVLYSYCLFIFVSNVAMGYQFWIIIVSLVPSTSFGITDFHQRSHRRHIGTFYPKTPTNYWETGLRESVYRTFLRKGYVDPSLRDQILNAPLILTHYKQQEATPFGDIAVLARGQLYFAAGGLQFVQDEHSYDCDECGREQPLLRFHQGQIVALWTVKRLRHHDRNGYHRYETEYLISLGAGNIFKGNGAFNYDIPGYIFILKDARIQNGNLWNRENPSWYKQEEEKHFGFDSSRLYLPPVFSTATTPTFYYYTTPKTVFDHDPDIIPAKNNVQKEIELYNRLLQSLKQAQPSDGVRFPAAATTKPFRPSPTYIKYSEPDPLYTTIKTPPITTRKIYQKVQTTTEIPKNRIPSTTTQRALTIRPFLPTPVHTKYSGPNLLHTITEVPPRIKIESTTRKVFQKIQDVPSTTQTPSTTTPKPVVTTAFKPVPMYAKYSEADPLYTTTKAPPTTVRIETTARKSYQMVQDVSSTIKIPKITTTQTPAITTVFKPIPTKYSEADPLYTTTTQKPTITTIFKPIPTKYSEADPLYTTTTQKPTITTVFKSIPTIASEAVPLYTTTKTPPTTVRIETTTKEVYQKVQDGQSSTQTSKMFVTPSITTQRPLTTTTFDIFDVFVQPKQKQASLNRNQASMRNKQPQHLLSQTIPADTTVNIQTTTPRTPTSIALQDKMAETTTIMSVPIRTTLRTPISKTTTKIPTTFTLVQTQSHYSTTVKFSTNLPNPSVTTELPLNRLSTVVTSSTELPKPTLETRKESNGNVFTETTQSPFYLSTISKTTTDFPTSTLKTHVEPIENLFAKTTESPISKLSTELHKPTLKIENGFTETTQTPSYLSTIFKSSPEDAPKSTMESLVEPTKVTTQTTPTPKLTETTKYLTTTEDVTEKLTTPALITAPESVLDQQTSFTETKYIATSTMTPTTMHLFTETTLDERRSTEIVNTTPRSMRKYTKIPTRTYVKNRIDKLTMTETTKHTQNFTVATTEFSTRDYTTPTTPLIQEAQTGMATSTPQAPTYSTTTPNVEIQTQNPLQTTTLSTTKNHVSTQGSTSATSVNSGEVFDEIFGKFSKEIITHPTPSSPKKIVTLNPDLAKEIFGISPRNYEGDSGENESAQIEQIVAKTVENPPKIIFDNFFEASTFPTTDEGYNNVETTIPTEFTRNDIFTTSMANLATEQTTIYPETTTAGNVESPKKDMMRKGDDDLEITKIITIQIRNVTKPDKRDTYNVSEDVIKADVTKINVGDNNFLIYKAIADGKDMIKVSNSTRDETDLFDNLALSVINHAKSINYLNRKKHGPRRKKVYKLKTRHKGKMQ